jgi:hypothetical protein
MALPLIPAGIAAARGLSFYAKSPAGRALMKRMMSKYKTVKGKSNIPNVNPTKGRSTKPSKPPKDFNYKTNPFSQAITQSMKKKIPFGRIGTSTEVSSEQSDADFLAQNQDNFDEGLKDLIKSLKTKPKRQSNARNRARRNIPKPVRKPKRKG